MTPLQSNCKWKQVDYLLEVVGVVQLIDITNFLQRIDQLESWMENCSSTDLFLGLINGPSMSCLTCAVAILYFQLSLSFSSLLASM